MPKEKSIPKRLSGTEALDSMLHQIRTRLANHGHFHSHKAYHGYSASVTIEFRPVRSFAPPLTDEFQIEEGDPEDEFGEAVNLSVEIDAAPPNAVREEAGMDMPVQVEENGRTIEKMVPAAKYKGRLKPGIKKPSTANMSTPSYTAKNDIGPDLVEHFGIQQRP